MAIGFVMYEGPSLIGDGDIAAIATLSSSNRKTGDMVQLWTLPQSMGTLEALQSGQNSAACGSCPLMGTPVRNGNSVSLKDRVCYVNLGQLDNTVVKAYRNGRYAPYNRRLHERFLRGESIRLGAYGDPAALPDSLLFYMVGISGGHTGYSNQLFRLPRRRANRLAKILMASCHTPAQHAEAVRRNWRPYTVISSEQSPPEGAVECPNYTHGVKCKTCLLCQGTSKRAKPVWARAHASVGRNLPTIQKMEVLS